MEKKLPITMPSVEILRDLPPAAVAGLACEAAAIGDMKALRELVRASANVGELCTPYDMRTPLHLAAACGHLQMVQFLVEECSATLQRDRFGLLPINDAVQNGHSDVRRYLQSKKLALKDKPQARKVRTESLDLLESIPRSDRIEGPSDEMMSTVFELVLKEGVFSYNTAYAEVQHYFKSLGLHPLYFSQFTPLQVAKHIHCLIAAKRVARATGNISSMEFVLTTEQHGFFLTAMDSPTPTEAELKTEKRMSAFLDNLLTKNQGVGLTFMASEGVPFQGAKERLGIFSAAMDRFDATRINDEETSLEVLASARFLKEKSRHALEQYQILMEDIVASRRPTGRIVDGSNYPGNTGYVLQFGTPETLGRHYLVEVFHAIRFAGLRLQRCYMDSYANGVITYNLFFPSASSEEVQKLSVTIMQCTLFCTSNMIYRNVMQAKIPHEVGLYMSVAVKFVYAFFPKEQYAPEYAQLHDVLGRDPGNQAKLETLYKLCMRELLSTERIFFLVEQHMQLVALFFEDFRSIATGKAERRFNEELAQEIDKVCIDQQDRQILKMFLTFNHAILLTNFFMELKDKPPSGFAFLLEPSVVLKDRPSYLYPEMPYGIYLVSGRNFVGFHVRFRDVARGGVRVQLSRDKTSYERNNATLFDECYRVGLVQELTNTDIPEGGSRGVILPDLDVENVGDENQGQSVATQSSCFTRYIDSLLDCLLAEECFLYTGHMNGRKEFLFIGPEETTRDFMDMGAELGRIRGYRYWKGLTSGKTARLGGISHNTYGMTTICIQTLIQELLKELGEAPSSITKIQIGGPASDIGSNEILASSNKTMAVIDESGVLYDPEGLNPSELCRLARRRVPVKDFSRIYLSKDGFLVRAEEKNVELPDGSKWQTGIELRDGFLFTPYATADLFLSVLAGRPNMVHSSNVKGCFSADKGGKPKMRILVESSNGFFSDKARDILEKAGVHIFVEATARKGSVISSSMECFCALALSDEDHKELMTFDPDSRNNADPPAFYSAYVQEIRDFIIKQSQAEFRAIWACHKLEGISMVAATRLIATKINRIGDGISEQLRSGMPAKEKQLFLRGVLRQAVPRFMLDRVGLDKIMFHMPENYLIQLASARIASHFVYRHGTKASEVAFFMFMRSLLATFASQAAKDFKEAAPAPASNQKRPAEDGGGQDAQRSVAPKLA